MRGGVVRVAIIKDADTTGDPARIEVVEGEPAERAVAALVGHVRVERLLKRFERGELRLRVGIADHAQHPPTARRAKGIAELFAGEASAIKLPDFVQHWLERRRLEHGFVHQELMPVAQVNVRALQVLFNREEEAVVDSLDVGGAVVEVGTGLGGVTDRGRAGGSAVGGEELAGD